MRTYLRLASACLLFGGALTAIIWGGTRHLIAADQFGCVKCSRCGHEVCHSQVETAKTKKHTWDIQQKKVCIPAVRFPWQKCCEPKCGRVRPIRVLKKQEYTVESCKHRWITPDCCPTCSKATPSSPNR